MGRYLSTKYMYLPCIFPYPYMILWSTTKHFGQSGLVKGLQLIIIRIVMIFVAVANQTKETRRVLFDKVHVTAAFKFSFHSPPRCQLPQRQCTSSPPPTSAPTAIPTLMHTIRFSLPVADHREPLPHPSSSSCHQKSTRSALLVCSHTSFGRTTSCIVLSPSRALRHSIKFVRSLCDTMRRVFDTPL